MKKLLKKAKSSLKYANLLTSEQKNQVLLSLSEKLLKNKNKLIEQNQLDIANAKQAKLSPALIDRLLLDEKRIDDMALSLQSIAKQDDPIGKTLKTWMIEEDLKAKQVSTPIGVICIIYESRPNVTSDTFALCLKSSNVCLLKGGKEARNSNLYLVELIKQTLKKQNINEDLISYLDIARDEVATLLTMDKYIDLIIPRGGEGLVKFVSKHSSIPVIKHDKGLCHLYIDIHASLEKALNIAINAKCQRTGVCNAIETLLVHEDRAEILPLLKAEFEKNHTLLKGCDKTLSYINIEKATKDDWDAEYLDNILSIKIVKSIDEAIEHISKHGSLHSEAIVSEDEKSIEKFLHEVDASCVYANASTRFTDGGVFGFGAEVGISTNKLHVRGPVGAEHLTTYKYKLYGNANVRG